MATHSSILALRIPWIDHGVTESDTTEWLTHSPCLSFSWARRVHTVVNTTCYTGLPLLGKLKRSYKRSLSKPACVRRWLLQGKFSFLSKPGIKALLMALEAPSPNQRTTRKVPVGTLFHVFDFAWFQSWRAWLQSVPQTLLIILRIIIITISLMHCIRQHIKKQRHYFANKGPAK